MHFFHRIASHAIADHFASRRTFINIINLAVLDEIILLKFKEAIICFFHICACEKNVSIPKYLRATFRVKTSMYTITRIYSDANGDSHFEEVQVDLHEKGEIGSLSDTIPAGDVIFREVPPDYDYDFHNAPQRQLIILIDGEIEIETSLGEKRTFGAGDVLLVEDTTGKGHKTRNLKAIRRKSLFITLPDSSLTNVAGN